MCWARRRRRRKRRSRTTGRRPSHRRRRRKPRLLEAVASDERLLGSRTQSGKRGIEVRARERLVFGEPFGEETRQAAAEGVAGAGGIDGRDGPGRNMVQ